MSQVRQKPRPSNAMDWDQEDVQSRKRVAEEQLPQRVDPRHRFARAE
jgi:hypothetical protein